MSLHDFWTRIKPYGEPSWRDFFLALVIILTATLSFGLGRLSTTGDREGIRIQFDESMADTRTTNSSGAGQSASAIRALPNAPASSTTVVGSKNGSKYHYSYCPGAKQIREENRLIFESAAAAEASGYALAANCKPR